MEDSKLADLTNQKVTISLGGKSYQARKATLNDVAEMQRFTKEKKDKDDDGSLDLDSTLFILWLVLRDDNPTIMDYKALGSLLTSPIDVMPEVRTAMVEVGLAKPQLKKEEETEPK